MSRDEIRIHIPRGPNERKQAAEVMAEFQRRIQAEHDAASRVPRLEPDDHKVIDGEIVEEEQP